MTTLKLKDNGLSRLREELAAYQTFLEALELIPSDMSHLQAQVLKYLSAMHTRTIECVETGDVLLASQFTNPVEILTAMDIHWYFHIQQIWMGAGVPNVHLAEDLAAIDKLPVPSDVCTAVRLGLHYMEIGTLPIPTAYLSFTEPCDAVAGMHAAFMHHPHWRDVPVFAPDPPYHNDERSYDYYAGELKRMVEFITQHTGKTLDINRLREVIEETNKRYVLWQEYNEIRRATPIAHDCMMPQSMLCMTNFPGCGDPQWTPWFQEMIEDAEMRIRENKPVVENQKIRILWHEFHPLYFGEIAPWMEQEFGAVIAMDMVCNCPFKIIDTSTEDTMFRGMAERVTTHVPMIRHSRGTAAETLSDIARMVKDYRIDCMIWPGHMGHKDATTGLMRDLCRDLGVPFLNIGMDSFDHRYTTVDQIKDKISQFFTAMGLA